MDPGQCVCSDKGWLGVPPEAARFANDDWRDLHHVMPLVTRLMSGVGGSHYVMSKFLTLCERAGSDYPLDAFSPMLVLLSKI